MKRYHQVLIVTGGAPEGEMAGAAAEILASLGIGARVAGKTAARGACPAGVKIAIAFAAEDPELPSRLARRWELPVLAAPGEARGRASALAALEGCVGAAREAPYGTLAVGMAGARNAALAAASILALDDAGVRRALLRFRARQTQEVLRARLG